MILLIPLSTVAWSNLYPSRLVWPDAAAAAGAGEGGSSAFQRLSPDCRGRLHLGGVPSNGNSSIKLQLLFLQSIRRVSE